MLLTIVAAIVAAVSLTVAFADRGTSNRARRHERSRPRIGSAHRAYDLRRHRCPDRTQRRPNRRRRHRRRSRRQRRALRRLRRREQRRDSWQLVGASPGTGRRTADGGRADRRRQSRADSGQRHRSHRSRRGRGLDALRFRLDRRRDQHHHGSAAHVQHGNALDRIVRRTDLSLSNAVSYVSAHVCDERLLGGQRAEPAKRASGSDGGQRSLLTFAWGARLNALWRSRRRTRRRARRARILLADERAEQSSIATCA